MASHWALFTVQKKMSRKQSLVAWPSISNSEISRRDARVHITTPCRDETGQSLYRIHGQDTITRVNNSVFCIDLHAT